ncbi:MAG: glycosyltransferase [Prevotella sp.]|nr:glycosyltransferase [Prevotella sp.]
MKVLLVNKFYYPRGGDCVYTINLEILLKKHGHEVAVFAMEHPQTLDTPWREYFPSEVKFRLGPSLFDAFMRPFGTKEVKEKFVRILERFQPDVVHLNNIHSQLSPIVAELSHQKGAKVVWTMHDYKLICPRYDCRRDDGIDCNECFAQSQQGACQQKFNVFRHKCMKNSYLASYIAYREAVKWSRERLEKCTDYFICPSRFLADKMLEGGFDGNKLMVHTNFIDTGKCDVPNFSKEDYYCYVGRLSQEKGVKTLVEAANKLPYRLYVIGKGPMERELKMMAKDNVILLGKKGWDEIKDIERRAKFSVIASEMNENNPLSVIESECIGTPVLGARIGGIPELIDEGVNGMTFESGNVADLMGKIKEMMHQTFDYQQIADQAKRKFSDLAYYDFLQQLYQSTTL